MEYHSIDAEVTYIEQNIISEATRNAYFNSCSRFISWLLDSGNENLVSDALKSQLDTKFGDKETELVDLLVRIDEEGIDDIEIENRTEFYNMKLKALKDSQVVFIKQFIITNAPVYIQTRLEINKPVNFELITSRIFIT
eukprot:NODE_139_length_16235_cov_0.569038.p12 type:complete len:139 gc:universal NODE_139_length_16235_cov_0.569038:13718-14134(+)